MSERSPTIFLMGGGSFLTSVGTARIWSSAARRGFSSRSTDLDVKLPARYCSQASCRFSMARGRCSVSVRSRRAAAPSVQRWVPVPRLRYRRRGVRSSRPSVAARGRIGPALLGQGRPGPPWRPSPEAVREHRSARTRPVPRPDRPAARRAWPRLRDIPAQLAPAMHELLIPPLFRAALLGFLHEATPVSLPAVEFHLRYMRDRGWGRSASRSESACRKPSAGPASPPTAYR